MRRITKAALGGLAGCALILGATQAASGESSKIVYEGSGELSDLQPAFAGPLDDASASIRILESPEEGTGFKLRVTGINLGTVNNEFGAHLHVGPCTERVLSTDDLGVTTVSADTTGAHYNSNGPVSEANPASPANEVWFDLVPENITKRSAIDETWVLFDIKDTTSPGDMSIVLHTLPTDPTTFNGFAGNREACLPVVSDWAN